MPDPVIHCKYDAIIPAAELKALIHPRNPNRHKQKQIDLIGHVIASLGFRHPIVISNQSGKAAAGNGRIYATIAKNWSGAPVVYQDFTEAEEKAFLLADNRLAELSDRDDPAVAALLREIGESGLDTLLSGYDGASMDKLLARLGQDEAENALVDPQVEPSAELATKWGTERGQLWILGEHRLMIGNSRNVETWEALMGKEKAALTFTDPPFGVGYMDSKGRSIEGDDLQRDDLAALVSESFAHAVRFTTDDCPFYVWHASSTRDDFTFALKAAGITERQYLTWVKEGFVLGHENYHWQTEHAFYAAKEGHRPRWFGDRSQSTVWRITGQDPAAGVLVGKDGVLLTDGHGRQLLVKESPPPKSKSKIRHFRIASGETIVLQPQDPSTAWCVSRDPVAEYLHPNQKPAALAEIALKTSSQPGDIVVDFFSGSGGTMIACEQRGRRARCADNSPIYAAASIERWHLLTKKHPVRAAA